VLFVLQQFFQISIKSLIRQLAMAIFVSVRYILRATIDEDSINFASILKQFWASKHERTLELKESENNYEHCL